MNVREDACKVTAFSIGLPADYTLDNVKLFNHLTLKVQQLLVDTKKNQTRSGFVGVRTSSTAYGKLRTPALSSSKSLREREREREPTFKLITLNFAT